jgi:hypothetical protein
MKFKVSKKEMNRNYSRIISIGYCNAYWLLKYKEPIAYSTRAEGWSCDYYDVDGVLISTGYAPLSSKNTHSNYDIVQRYNKQAEKIACDYALSYEDRANRVNALLKEYIKEVTK